MEFPKGWKVNKTTQPLHLAAGQTLRVPFAIEQGVNAVDNSYPLSIEIAGQGGPWTYRQAIVCATAPYLDIQVDGQTDDWKDSVPLTFVSAGKKTTIRTAYTRRNFFLLVGVEQTTHRPLGAGTGGPVMPCNWPWQATLSRPLPTARNRADSNSCWPAGDQAHCYLLTRPDETLPVAP